MSLSKERMLLIKQYPWVLTDETALDMVYVDGQIRPNVLAADPEAGEVVCMAFTITDDPLNENAPFKMEALLDPNGDTVTYRMKGTVEIKKAE